MDTSKHSNGVTSRPRSICRESANSLRYLLNYRDQEEMMRERGLHIDHTMTYRSRAMLCTRTGEALPIRSQCHERLMARQ